MSLDLAARLAGLAKRALLRTHRTVDTPCAPEVTVDGRPLLAFCSNDYLGLAADPRLVHAACEGARRWGVGSGASRLVSGNYAVHDALEQRLAAFVGCPRALLFSTGYMANLAVVTAMAGRGDAIFSDALNHASLIDAVRLSGAEKHIYAHRDVGALSRLLRANTSALKLIVTDAVFSMDGDLAPLPQLLDLAERHHAWLVVDDAHGFGVLGERGRGSLAHFGLASPRILYMGTLGKAAGVAGAFVAGAGDAVEWLLQRARTHIFTTGSPPLLAQALLASVDIIEREQARREHLFALVRRLRSALQFERWQLLPSDTPIQPVVIGGNEETLRAAAALQDRGLWVPAIRPPTVPEGTARLRVSLSAAHTPAHVDRLSAALLEIEAAG